MQEETHTFVSNSPSGDVNIKKIVLAIDASPLSQIATGEAVKLAARLGAEIHAIYVEDGKINKMASHAYVRTISPFVEASQTFDEEAIHTIVKLQISKAKSYLEHAVEGLKIPHSFEVRHGKVNEEIIEAAQTADLMVMGWSGWQTTTLYGEAYTKNSSSFKIINLGDNAKKIINNIDNASILTIRGKFESSLPIITAFDGSEETEKTLRMAATIFKASRDRRGQKKVNRRRKEAAEENRRKDDSSLLSSIKNKTKKIITRNGKERNTKEEITVFLLIDNVVHTLELENKANEILASSNCKANFVPLPSVNSAEEFEKIFIPPLHLMTGGIVVLSEKSPLYGNIKPADMTDEMLNAIPCSLLLVN